MNGAILALVAGTILAVGALAFVLYPLFFDEAQPRATILPRASDSWTDDIAVAALREIEFDRATGKLSETDYTQLKEQYTRQAVASMRRASTGAAPNADDEVEAAIRAYRAWRPTCAHCGPRPEPDAVFCSNCGRYLPGTCTQCGRHVEEVGARFCAACGNRLAA
jgi:hypothetical protein